MKNNQDALINAIVSWFIAPSFLATTVVAIYNLASKSIQSASDQSSTESQQQDESLNDESNQIAPIMSEPAPSKTMIRQQMPPTHQHLITNNGAMLLDKDLQFISGESEMPLSVYEGPLMNAYRSFTKLKKDKGADGYYVVHRRKIMSNRKTTGREQRTMSRNRQQQQDQLERSIEELLKNESEEDLYGEHDDSEIMLLYGRGPVFSLASDYGNDRFEGIED